MTSITQASLRYVQELGTFLGPQNRTQGHCVCILCRSVLQVRLLLCVRDGPREPHEEGALLGPGQHLHQAGQQLPLQTVQLHQRPAHQHQVSSNRPSVN